LKTAQYLIFFTAPFCFSRDPDRMLAARRPGRDQGVFRSSEIRLVEEDALTIESGASFARLGARNLL
jgi:hypothetical protein